MKSYVTLVTYEVFKLTFKLLPVAALCMGVATGGASRSRAPPFCLSGGAGPPNFLRVLIISATVRARNLRTGLSKAGMSLNYQLTNGLQRLIWSRQRSEWVPLILSSNSPMDWLIRLILNSEFELRLTVKRSWEAEMVKNNRLKIKGVVGSITTVSLFCMIITVWWGNVRWLQTS